ncbi:RE1 [Symbiodinium sp. CCMP2592]|nr:RE1 [Symbiodinium sp. CCMP2592]
MAALPAAQAVPDDDDDDLGGPVLPPLQPIRETVSGNPWPAAGSPVSSDQVTALLHQLGNTTALLGQVIGQRSASDSSVSGLTGKDMSRIMPRPEPFRAATREQEHSAWPSWLWSLEQYLTVLDPKFGEEIDQLKSNLHRQVNISPAATDIVARSRQLFALLSVLVKGRGFLVIKSVHATLPEDASYAAVRDCVLRIERQQFKWKYKADLKAGKVQAVSEESGSTVSTVTPSQSASQVGAKGRVARLAEIDLTAFDECDEEFLDGDTRVCMIQCSMERVEHFSISDPSEVRCNAWDTICEYELLSLPSDVLLKLCEAKHLECHADHSKSLADPFKCHADHSRSRADSFKCPADQSRSLADSVKCPVHQVSCDADQVMPLKPSVYVHGSVRALASVNGEDIILDSGADISALPETYAQVGDPAPSSAQRFVDASGRLLQSKGIRIAEVRVGSIRFREKFLIGGVTCPLLSLGKLYKAGFYVIPSTSGDSDVPRPLKRDLRLLLPVTLKKPFPNICTTFRCKLLLLNSSCVLSAQSSATSSASSGAWKLKGTNIPSAWGGWKGLCSDCIRCFAPSLKLLLRGMSAEAFYPDEGAVSQSVESGQQVPLSAIPASPISPNSAVVEGTPDQGPLAAFMSSPVEGDDLTEEQLGGLMSREDTQPPPDDDPTAGRLEQQLAGFIAYGGSAGDWHAMNSGFILARHSRQAMPWERVTRPRLGPGFMFQEPLLGRFDGLRRAAIPAPAAGPWAWVPKGTDEARRLLAARFAKSDDMLRLTALKKIRLIVLFFPDDSELGRNLVGSAGSLVEESMLTSTIEDTFSGRAASTLLKRASDFSRFAKWIVASKGRPLAPSEGELYAYMLHLRREKAGATAGESFLKAYRFFVHLTGAAQGSRISPRVQGAAKAMSMGKRPLWQAPPLPVEAVRLLEEFVHDSEDYARASIAGFILFCLYSSARWSDAARGTDLSIDVAGNGLVLLECSTKHYKTKAKDRKDTVLPLIALGSGLTQPSWGRVWMRKRALAGLPDCAVIMPAMSPGGNFLGRAMTAAEGSLWLREFLHLQGFTGDLEQYSSHSLKATALSWTAKSGTMTYEERLTQGHHCSPKHGMALLYSRDALAEIIVKVAKVVSAVSRGVLSPDLPRAERVARALHGDPADFAHLPETTAEDLPAEEPQDENNSEAGSDITNLDGLEVDLGAPAPEEVRPRLSCTFSGETYMHVLSGVVHKLVNPGIFKCGRKVTANMRLMGMCSVDRLLICDVVPMPFEMRVPGPIEISGVFLASEHKTGLMAGLESVPAFTDRAKQIGISEDLLTKLLAKSLDTFGKLAFVCSSKPSSGDDTPLFEALKTLIGSEVPVEQHMVIRRLWYESHAHALVDLESRASRTSDTSPRELPLAERLTRLKRQRGELKGLEMDIHTEPGHGLVDRVQAMLDSAQVLHIAPEKCISRHDEILGEKTEQKISLGADGNIKITKQASSLRCETTGELKLRRCFLRRALAFDQVGLASYTAMESWHNRMFQALLDVPPAGYRYTTVQQLLAADQKLWQVVAQESRGDIVVGVGAPAPLDKHIAAAATNQFVVSCHLPKPAENQAQPWKPNKGPDKGNQKGEKGNKGKGRGKGKQNHSQGQADASSQPSLKELLESLPEGCVRANDDGRFICPFYNKGICRFQKRKSCRFGKHVCNFKGLFDALPHEQCDRDAEGLFPQTVRVVNRFVASLLEGAVYTSFAIFDQVCTRPHRDSQNAFSPNYVIPLTIFQGGAIRVSEPDRTVDLQVSRGPVKFCAREFEHRTLPATGRRVVLVLFALQAGGRLSGADRRVLLDLGFPLPSASHLASKEACASQQVSVTDQMRQLLPLKTPASPSTQPEPRASVPAPSELSETNSPCQAPSAERPSAASASSGTSEGCNSLSKQGPSSVPRPPLLVDCLAEAGSLSAAAMRAGWDALSLGHKGGAQSPALEYRWTSPLAMICKLCSISTGRSSLRDASHLLGRDGLPALAASLVLRDNGLVQAVVDLLFRAYETRALVSLIAPARSWVWSLLAHFVKRRRHSGFLQWFFALADQELDTCMFGAPFLTSLRVRAESFSFPGVYFSMEEHLHRACELPSPADNSTRLPDAVRRNIFAILTEGPVAVSKRRMLELKSLNDRMAALSAAEKELRAKMHPDVERVTKGKALALFRELLEETGFPDLAVVNLLSEGVPLVGQEAESPLFAKRPKPKDLEPDQLKTQAALRRRALQKMKGLTSEQDYKAMKAETSEELAAGFLTGPYHTEQEVSDILKTDAWSLSPRFLLRQGEDAKIRIIDDFKMSAVNKAFGSSSFLELQDTDYAVGLLRFLSRVLQDRSKVRVPLSDGTLLEGDWDPEMLRQPALLGKTLDLSKAYRQVSIHPSTREHAVLGFPNPQGKWEFYIAQSLPFGAAASVYGFNKVALAILHIMVVKFAAIATDFYDDYTVYEFRPAAFLLDKVLMRLLDLLGWSYAKSGRKFVPFDNKVVSLGVSLGLDEIWQGTLKVENKAGRLEKIAALLRAVAQGGAVTRSDVASLHGLINFAGGLIMGFELKPTSRMLTRALSGPFLGNMPELRQACELALDVIAQCRPKRCPATILPPVVLYTDGAFEKGRGTWGAILVDAYTSSRWVFGGEVCKPLMDHWGREAGAQVICQVEAYALAITLFGIRGFLKGRSVLAWIDNNACLYGFVKRYSPSASLMRLISLGALMESSMEALMWFERVPSKSNPADLPSRGLFAQACDRFQAINKGDVAATDTMLDFIRAPNYEPKLAQALKRQSLCATGSVRVLNALPSAVRAVSAALHGPLLRLDASGWQRIGSRRYALLSFGQSYVDSTLIPLTELLWYRTTLVRRDGRWTVAELAADVSSLTDRTLPLGPPAVEQVITIAYDDASLSPESLGFSPSDSDDVPSSQGAGSVEAPEVPVPDAADQGPEVPVPDAADQGPEVPMPDAADQGAGVGGLEGDSDLPPSADQAAPVAPAADGGGEAAPSEREVIDSVTVNGVVIDRNSSLRVMRAALVSLGLGKNGSKSQCWERLVRHLREADLLREHQVHHNLSAELSRPPHAPPVPAAPSDHDRAQHVLTHEPYQPWCDACVKFRGRQDRHSSEASHDPGSRSVLSFDFGYCSREADDGVREAKDRLTVLFLHDRHTKAVHAIPTAQKGGSSLSHLVTESARFAIWLGHRSLRLRCDNEPAILAVQAGLLKALRNLGVDVSKDTAPVESHQSNGPVEQVVGSIRQHAAVLMHDLEQACGAKDDQVLFPPLHPIYGWALAHACWLRNRYTPVHGTTPYEAVTDSAYSGTICRFGEKVLGYLKPDGKSSARWRHGLWLGKAIGNDTHILGLVGGVFVTRSVRRFEDNFDPDFAASFDVSVFEHGLSSIGGKLVLGHKKPAAPVAMPIPAYVGPPPSPPAAAESPLPHEARGSPSQIAGTDSPVRSPTSINYSPSDGMSATEDAALSDRHGDVLSTDAGEPSSAEAGMPAIPAEAGAAASSAPLISEALGLSENPRPAKVARRSDDDQVMALEGQISLITAPGCCADEVPAGDLLVTSGEESPCVVHIRQVCYEHEDENVTLTFDGDTLDELEDYDQSFLEDQSGDTELLPELCRPRTSDIEPELSPEELEALDVIADGVEIARLEGMTVLLPESAAHNDEYAGQEATHLTTRMVRTWREKELGGSPVWYRRSRYVAREYAWLNERHDLFSPASTALSNRLLPIHYLCHEPDPDDPWVMVALDISDAYLSVKQTRLVIVQHAGVRYVLGRVLPGQRDGSKEWYLAFSSFLDEALGFKKCDALPSLIREPASKFSMQMHVDDLLGAGSKRFLLERLRPTLESKYRVSIRILEAPGDTISFLKRHHTLLADGKMLLTPSAKHFEKLFSVMKIDERSAPKKTPYAPQLDEVDNSELLACADAKAFRCAIGILLYLAVDLIECQGAIRALSSYMTSPTRNAQAALRHLLKYLLEGQHHGLLLDRRNCYNGVSGEIPRPSQPILCLEAFSDANWAAHRGSRKSVSSGMVFVAGCLLYSSSRTQRVIALSSGESELLAATSTLCDALFVRQLLAFIADDEPPQIHHFLDASAAKGIMERSGVGRVRHLSVRVLWTQQLVADKIIMLRKVATSINVADLNTKGLSRSRMLMLLHIIGCWHTVYECFVGEDEIADLRYKQAMKDAVRAVRSASSASVSKPMIQAIVIAVVSALSRAADDADGDNGLDDSGADLPDWANRVLVWFLGLWVRDDTGVSVIDMLVQPHALILACVTMLMLVLCIRTLCCRASDRGQVNVQIAGPRDHVSFQFDRQLNLHVGVGAPGTPTNPLSFDFDGDDSPPHVLSALRKGARSKASTRPGPRYDDEDAPHPDASSSAAPPTGAMNAVQAHVPPADHASAPGTPAESMSSQLSTQSFRELHGYPIAVARRMNHRGSLVWVSHTGRCYHRLRCFKLDGCDRVKAYERHEAQNRGLRACKKCNP